MNGTVCHTTRFRDRLHQLESVPLNNGGLRQSQRFERSRISRDRDMWPVGSLIELNASCEHSSLDGLNQALHFRWNRGCSECGNLRARPEFEPIKAQTERFHADRAFRLVQLINTLNREFADVNQCDVPFATGLMKSRMRSRCRWSGHKAKNRRFVATNRACRERLAAHVQRSTHV